LCDVANCTSVLVQQHVNRNKFFDRSWNEFKAEFGSRNGNYWIGNDKLHQLTRDGRYKLRVELQQRNLPQKYMVEYSTFRVGSEAVDYKLVVNGFSGSIGDMFAGHNGARFSTYDRDNDRWDVENRYNGSCAVYRGGGFWYWGCGYANVNGQEQHFYWIGLPEDHLLQSSRMTLICR